MSIVHVFPRSPFLPFVADVFDDVAPGANTFLVHGQEMAPQVIRSGVETIPVVLDADGLRETRARIASSDLVIFHSMILATAALMADAPRSTLRMWSGWGGDYYGSRFSPSAGLLRPMTERYRRHGLTLRNRLGAAYDYARAVAPLDRAATATDLFSAPVPDDLDVFRRRFRGFHGEYAQINYASLEDTFRPSSEAAQGDDILLGNSASLTNNHLDVLEDLVRVHQPGRRIITPLSYGDPAYGDVVAARGAELFGEDFMAVRDFMPLTDYQELIGGCSAVVMGHRRQQGVGNIAAALSSGAHLLLDARSPLYRFFLDRGIHVEPIGRARALPVGRVDERTQSVRDHVIRDFWGRERVLQNARDLIARV